MEGQPAKRPATQRGSVALLRRRTLPVQEIKRNTTKDPEIGME